MKLVLLLFFGRLGHQGSTENFCTFAKVFYPYLSCFFMLSCGKTINYRFKMNFGVQNRPEYIVSIYITWDI